jgi:HAE1 family hydrophobic/amphiphilic exporter-1
MLNVDNDKAQQKGVTIENAMGTLSTLIGSDYETSFIKYDRMYKVMVQALPQYRALPQDILKLYVKNDKGEMVPFSAFMSVDKVYGLSEITRHNMYNAAEVSGGAAPGYSSGTAIAAITEVAKNKLPKGFGIDWAGISKDEIGRGNEAIYIFLICLAFVYLLLAAQYESFILPFPIILSLPAGIFGAFFLLKSIEPGKQYLCADLYGDVDWVAGKKCRLNSRVCCSKTSRRIYRIPGGNCGRSNSSPSNLNDIICIYCRIDSVGDCNGARRNR